MAISMINYEIDEAIKFLVVQYVKSGTNPKPVVLHSIRVGLYLARVGYRREIVLAGILHDLLEDSKTTFAMISKKFGSKVAKLVQANSFDPNIIDQDERFKDLFVRCKKEGFSALIVKTADTLDNSDYYLLYKDKNSFCFLIYKMSYFLDFTKNIIGKEEVWKELKKRYDKLSKKCK